MLVKTFLAARPRLAGNLPAAWGSTGHALPKGVADHQRECDGCRGCGAGHKFHFKEPRFIVHGHQYLPAILGLQWGVHPRGALLAPSGYRRAMSLPHSSGACRHPHAYRRSIWLRTVIFAGVVFDGRHAKTCVVRWQGRAGASGAG